MKSTMFLTIDCDGKNARVTKRPVAVEPYQVCVRLSVDIPDAYFERPQFNAEIKLPEPSEPIPSAVDVSAAEDSLREATGMNIQLVVAPSEVA